MLLRLVLALQLLLSGLAPVAAQAWTQPGSHDDCCCRCEAGGNDSTPSWQTPPCSCGCIQPFTPHDEQPQAPRTRAQASSELPAFVALASDCCFTQHLDLRHESSPRATRGPPKLPAWRLTRPAFTCWQE